MASDEEDRALDDDDVRKPGQKFITPSPGFSDRVFYESLLEQRPESQMAQEYCVLHGILSYEKAEKLHKLVCKRKGIPFVSSSPQKKSASSKSSRVKKENQVVDESSITVSSEEIGLDVGNGDETIGGIGF